MVVERSERVLDGGRTEPDKVAALDGRTRHGPDTDGRVPYGRKPDGRVVEGRSVDGEVLDR